MTFKLSTAFAAALVLGATSGAALADSGGPGGKGDATTGTLGVQQRQDADSARELTGTPSVHNNRDVTRDGVVQTEVVPVERDGGDRQATIGSERARGDVEVVR